MAQIPIFDGHNDLLFRLWRGRPDAIDGFATGSDGHIDLPRARKGGFCGGFFAIFVPPTGDFDPAWLQAENYDIPLPPKTDAEPALRIVTEQAAILLELDRRGQLRLCRSGSETRAAIDSGQIAAIMHMEGAEAIGADLDALDVLYAAGVRSIGPVWSRPTIFGHGVPFRFPADGDIGPGLTDDGKRFMARAAKLGMVVDTSHLNMAGFWDVAEAGLPLVATHSNVHFLCASARNLTDDQLRAIGETRGMVGLNYLTAFLRPDGRMFPDGAFEHMTRHLARMVELAGEDHVGLGSDFDGGMVPEEIGDVAGLDALRDALAKAGFDEALMRKICHENWLSHLTRVLG